MAMVVVVFFILLSALAAYATDHVVGGSSGWTQSVDYSTWAAGQTFTVGDTLLFQYGGTHSVDVVSQSDYTNCNTGDALKSYKGGKTTVELDSAGSMYFICPTMGHCTGGMKLAITVAAGATTAPPSTTNATATPPPPLPPNSAVTGFGGRCFSVLGISLVVVTLVTLTI